VIHNDVLRAIRHILNVRDAKLVEIIQLADPAFVLDDISPYLKSEEEPGFKECGDDIMARFLDGLVLSKRGPSDHAHPTPRNQRITNNVTLKKLRVAFELKDSDIAAILAKAGVTIGKTELSSFFRAPDHRNYRACGDQFLRNFLKGMNV
jgi:uncharacterized protein YehS (DUF1456 family)